jgi:hypothetical protein
VSCFLLRVVMSMYVWMGDCVGSVYVVEVEVEGRGRAKLGWVEVSLGEAAG